MQDAMFVTPGRQPLLPPFIVSSLLQLNRRLLELAARPRPTSGWHPYVPENLALRLARMNEERREALARVPYALFDLHFADDARWERALTCAAHPRVTDAGAREADAQQFAQIIVFFAWNVAQAAPRCAPLVLGMSERVAAALAALTLDRLPELHGLLRGALSLRWPERRSYWFALTSGSHLPGSADFRRTQLFGLQLAAAARLDCAALTDARAAGQERIAAR